MKLSNLLLASVFAFSGAAAFAEVAAEKAAEVQKSTEVQQKTVETKTEKAPGKKAKMMKKVKKDSKKTEVAPKAE